MAQRSEKPAAGDERLAAFLHNPMRLLIEQMAARIAAEYQPEQIILYGSQATNQIRPDSDIDLFVVKQAQESYVKRCATVRRIVRDLSGKVAVSPIVLTPEEIDKRLDRGDQFIQQIFARGIHLYHAPNDWPRNRRPLLEGLRMATKQKDSLYPQNWLRVAERDWQRVEKRLAEGDQEDAGFRLQQALEKYLKAFLLANGWELDKTHDLTKLLAETIKYKNELNLFSDLCERVENYYMADRYPSELDAGISLEQVEKDFSEAGQLRDRLLTAFENKAESTERQDRPFKKQKQKPRQAKTKRSRQNR